MRACAGSFSRGETEFVKTGNSHVLGYIRSNEHGMVFLLANFTEDRQSVEARRLRQMVMRKTMVDVFPGRTITTTQELILEPYRFMVLARVS